MVLNSQPAATLPGGPSLRWVASIVSLSVVLGVAAWLIVDAWLAARTRDQVGFVDVRGASDTELDPSKRKPDASQPVAGQETKPPENDQATVNLPVVWAAAPSHFPKQGIAATLRDSRSDAVPAGVTTSFFEGFVKITGKLADGSYAWDSDDTLHFPTPAQVLIDVRDSVLNLRSMSGQKSHFITVYYLVPVHLIANIFGEAEVAISVRCDPTSTEGKLTGFQLDVTLRHNVAFKTYLPAGKLVFRRNRVGILLPASAESEIRSSLSGRAPQPEERIDLTVLSDVELRVNLISRSVDGVMRTLRHVSGIDANNPRVEWLQLLRVRVKLHGWGSENTDIALNGDWFVPPVAGGATACIRVVAPPLESPCRVRIEVMARPEESLDLWREIVVGTAEGSLSPGQAAYEVDANLLEYNWNVSVNVKDDKGVSRPDFLVSIRPMSKLGKQATWLGAVKGIRTNAQGLALFDGLPAAAGTGFHLQPELYLPKNLNGELKREYWFDGTSLETKLTLVVSSDLAQPIVFQLVPTPRPVVTADGRSVLSPIPYLLIPLAQNSRLVVDIETGHAPDKSGRLVTAVREPGEYVGLLMTPGGEVLVSVRHQGIAGGEVPVHVAPPHQVAVTCVGADGKVLEGAIIFTSTIEPSLAWALALGEQKNFIRYFRGQTTNKVGACKFMCQPQNADAGKWLIYHKSFGVSKAASVSGSLQVGFEIKCAANTSSSLTVQVPASARVVGARYTVCLTPIYCDGNAELSGLFVYLGQTIDLEAESVEFLNLPASRYAVALVQAGDNMAQSKGPKWSKVIQIESGGRLTLTLPQP